MAESSVRSQLKSQISLRKQDIISATHYLVAAASLNPPGDTTLVAEAAADLLGKDFKRSSRPKTCLQWTHGHLSDLRTPQLDSPTLDGVLKDGRVYGRGVSDLKGGIAASIMAATVLAEQKHLWSGEVVLTLAGDEESMGSLGTKWLLDNVEAARGDAMVCGDVGSPNVVRFGEKGFCWFEITACGVSAHGAHVHKGINAIDRLRKVLDAVERLENFVVDAPREVSKAIAAASQVSEAAPGEGEPQTLHEATAEGDIRLPVGISVAQVEEHLHKSLDAMPGVSWRMIRSHKPTYTSPTHPLVQTALSASEEVMGLGTKSVVNMRVDEYVMAGELVKVAQIHALIAYEFLKPK
ncbi:uncharacterized protein PAC_12256 [Phialocephala subalpina]|uniref:Peptidase M20 dimerisation domain-containing protein n=1 Tax=Phialocephala subalpina TaxID=576137 RepID=A0A1L7XBF9_9HELO|nr:uncharacterized protein PAC_12256 [Phialocephala subalpina]